MSLAKPSSFLSCFFRIAFTIHEPDCRGGQVTAQKRGHWGPLGLKGGGGGEDRTPDLGVMNPTL